MDRIRVTTRALVPFRSPSPPYEYPKKTRQQTVFRVYESIRTTHIDLLPSMVPGKLVYREQMYDYHGPGDSGAIVSRSGRMSTVRAILSGGFDYLELNEPLMIRAWPSLVLYTAAGMVARRILRHRFVVTTYAIENNPPGPAVASFLGVPLGVGTALAKVVTSFLLSGTDRIAFGTPAAQANYVGTVAAVRAIESQMQLELPQPCSCPAAPKLPLLVFVGDFSTRKGVDDVLRLWDAVTHRSVDSSLVLIGKGSMEDEVVEWARSRPSVTVHIDPPRSIIHRTLRQATALVLLSKSSPRWREQIGLPLMEGLSHGCEIISTDATGYSDWLREHGHVVVPETVDIDRVAHQVVDLFARPGRSIEISATLPRTEVRVLMDRWMHSSHGMDG